MTRHIPRPVEVFGGSEVQGEDGPGDANDLKLRTEQEQILIELGGKMACGAHTGWWFQILILNFTFPICLDFFGMLQLNQLILDGLG